MADFPLIQALPFTIHTWSRFSPLPEARSLLNVGSNPASGTWPTANLAIYIPFAIPFSYRVAVFFWGNGSAVVGNVDIGIFTKDGVKLVSTGSTAQSGADSIQYVTGLDFLLSPDRYYLGMSCSATTNAIALAANPVTLEPGRMMGLLQEASAVPLPAAATFAQFAVTGYPLCGFSRI